MAKTNQVTLCGVLKKDPRINERNDYASVVMKTMIGPRNDGENKKYRYVYTIIISRDPSIIDVIDTLKENDLVYVKGVVVTRNVTKKHPCPICHETVADDGQIVYCEPIYMEKIRSLEADETQKVLNEHCEISNEARVLGHVITDPHDVPGKNRSSKYRIAIERTYRLVNSTEDEKTDFPLVHSFGDNAKEDMLRIHSGSLVLIDGYLQSFEKKVPCKCPNCGADHEWSDTRMEIIPFETEYLHDYVTNKELNGEIVNEEDKDIDYEQSNTEMINSVVFD